MKYLALILSFYVQFLTTIPCVDGHNDHSSPACGFMQNQDESHPHDADHCSPFCTCQCCTSPVIFQECNIQFKCLSVPQELLFGFMPHSMPTIYKAIWQPPKIG